MIHRYSEYISGSGLSWRILLFQAAKHATSVAFQRHLKSRIRCEPTERHLKIGFSSTAVEPSFSIRLNQSSFEEKLQVGQDWAKYRFNPLIDESHTHARKRESPHLSLHNHLEC